MLLREYVICECSPESLSVATTVMTSDPRDAFSASVATYPPAGIVKMGWLSLVSVTLITSDTCCVCVCLYERERYKGMGGAYSCCKARHSTVSGRDGEREKRVAFSVQG